MYVDAAIGMVQRYNPASVFVSCDDPASASEFEVALRGAGIHISIVTAGVGNIYQGRSLLEDRVGTCWVRHFAFVADCRLLTCL
jgi:hypothetical protein